MAVLKQKEIEKVVAAVEREFRRDIVRIRYDVGTDWSGDWAIYFRILLSDEASKDSRLHHVAQRVTKRLREKIKPEELGVLPYYNFRSESEQAEL
jgi:hypothetical protein